MLMLFLHEEDATSFRPDNARLNFTSARFLPRVRSPATLTSAAAAVAAAAAACPTGLGKSPASTAVWLQNTLEKVVPVTQYSAYIRA
jgi:hypothetical protein